MRIGELLRADRCGLIVPRQDNLVGDFECGDYPGYIAECVEPNGHMGPHRFVTPDGRQFEWEYDYTCDCCAPDEDGHCYTWGELPERLDLDAD
jgi:hypothetical protein